MNNCLHCERHISRLSTGRIARYCSDACKMAAYRIRRSIVSCAAQDAVVLEIDLLRNDVTEQSFLCSCEYCKKDFGVTKRFLRFCNSTCKFLCYETLRNQSDGLGQVSTNKSDLDDVYDMDLTSADATAAAVVKSKSPHTITSGLLSHGDLNHD